MVILRGFSFSLTAYMVSTARLGTQGDLAHFGRILYVLVEILRIDLYFRQPHDAVGSHRLFGAHAGLLIQITEIT